MYLLKISRLVFLLQRSYSGTVLALRAFLTSASGHLFVAWIFLNKSMFLDTISSSAAVGGFDSRTRLSKIDWEVVFAVVFRVLWYGPVVVFRASSIVGIGRLATFLVCQKNARLVSR